MAEFCIDDWEGPDGALGQEIAARTEAMLRSYEVNPSLIEEHAGFEAWVQSGGYGHRQLYELIQNAADAILDGGADGLDGGADGAIEVLLTAKALYCANEGEPVDSAGAKALLLSYTSPKKARHIGHFGIGFKSVLGVTSRPEILSRTASFRFDRDKAAETIRGRLGFVGATPTMRTPEVFTPGELASADVELRSLMAWATTVVRLPLDSEVVTGLQADMLSFPAEFLLFSPHVAALTFRDLPGSGARNIHRVERDGSIVLREGGDESEWRVFTCPFEPSSEAAADSDNLRVGETVTLAWAVRLGEQRGRGAFWAFFPTTYESTVSGIVNAPWKTNADRQGLLEGPANREMLRAVAKLVGEALPDLYRASDPGSALDVLPVRDTLQWADQHLSEALFPEAAKVPFLPDSDGLLHRPPELRLLPDGSADAVEVWMGLPDRPPGWAHPRTNTRERRPRALKAGALEASACGWLEDVAKQGTVASSLAALQLAGKAGFRGQGPGDPKQARIILTSDGRLVNAATPRLFFYSGQESDPTATFVAEEVTANDEARAVLVALGVKELAPLAVLKLMLDRARTEQPVDWDKFWVTARKVEPGELDLYLTNPVTSRPFVKVLCLDSTWRPSWDVLLPGVVATPNGENDSVLVDTTYHVEELDFLAGPLGIAEGPSADAVRLRSQAPREYGRDFESNYRALPSLPGQPAAGYVEVKPKPSAGPVALFQRLTDDAKDRYVDALLPLAEADGTWLVGHASRANYPAMPVLTPAQWLIVTAGRIPTTLGRHRPSEAWSHSLADRVGRFLPCAMAEWKFLSLRSELGLISQGEAEAAVSATLTEKDPTFAWVLYPLLARARVAPPPYLLAAKGTTFLAEPSAETVVTSDRSEFDVIRADGADAVLITDARYVDDLVGWGLRQPSLPRELTLEQESVGEALADRFPGLPDRILNPWGDFELTPVAKLGWSIQGRRGTEFSERDVLVEGNRAYHLRTAARSSP